mgnify:CR=1 FL=1
MDWLLTVYWLLFLLGLGFSIMMAIFSGIGEAAGGGSDISMDHGADFGLDHDIGGLDHDIDVTAGDHFAGHGEVAMSPVSPMTIFAFIGGFGGGGLFANSIGLPGGFSLLVAVPTGLLVAFGIYWFMYKLNQTNVSSESRSSEVVGSTAEIITPIVEDGTGEVAYISRGSRYVAAARSIDGKSITKGKAVKIWRLVGSTCYVKEILPEEAEQPGVDTIDQMDG